MTKAGMITSQYLAKAYKFFERYITESEDDDDADEESINNDDKIKRQCSSVSYTASSTVRTRTVRRFQRPHVGANDVPTTAARTEIDDKYKSFTGPFPELNLIEGYYPGCDLSTLPSLTTSTVTSYDERSSSTRIKTNSPSFDDVIVKDVAKSEDIDNEQQYRYQYHRNKRPNRFEDTDGFVHLKYLNAARNSSRNSSTSSLECSKPELSVGGDNDNVNIKYDDDDDDDDNDSKDKKFTRKKNLNSPIKHKLIPTLNLIRALKSRNLKPEHHLISCRYVRRMHDSNITELNVEELGKWIDNRLKNPNNYFEDDDVDEFIQKKEDNWRSMNTTHSFS